MTTTQEKHLADTTLPNGVRVSTVRPLFHPFNGERMRGYETVVFGATPSGEDNPVFEHETEDEAQAAHDVLVMKYTDTPPLFDVTVQLSGGAGNPWTVRFGDDTAAQAATYDELVDLLAARLREHGPES